MKAPAFAYARPRSLEQAFGLLEKHGDGARVLAGGQSLVAMLNLRNGGSVQRLFVQPNPRAVAITNDAAEDSMETAFVTRMFARTVGNAPAELDVKTGFDCSPPVEATTGMQTRFRVVRLA